MRVFKRLRRKQQKAKETSSKPLYLPVYFFASFYQFTPSPEVDFQKRELLARAE